MNSCSFSVPDLPLTAADEPAQQPVPTQPLIWCELIAELTHWWSQKEIDLTGRKEREAPGVKHRPTSPKYWSCDGYERAALKTTAGDCKITNG